MKHALSLSLQPSSHSSTESDHRGSTDAQQQFPFELKKINKDSISCSHCPWYRYATSLMKDNELLCCILCSLSLLLRFCRGCPIDCDDNALGRTSGYIALDWNLTTLQLKYQSALERVSTRTCFTSNSNTYLSFSLPSTSPSSSPSLLSPLSSPLTAC